MGAERRTEAVGTYIGCGENLLQSLHADVSPIWPVIGCCSQNSKNSFAASEQTMDQRDQLSVYSKAEGISSGCTNTALIYGTNIQL